MHAGFEWLLAPNGDPALAPDVINNSWSGDGARTEFLPDVAAVQAAGIIPVFAAGNFGPAYGTISSPASFPHTIAVGASDEADQIPWFSSRGPSALTDETKPLLVAPGTNVLSSKPNGQYARHNGTSMATPHVVGAIALLLAANPNLTPVEISNRLTQTAVPLGETIPNRDSGYGRLDVYAALQNDVTHGVIEGALRHSSIPLPGAMLTITTPDGAQLPFQTDANGRFRAALLPGTYQLNTALFGFYPLGANVTVVANQTNIHNFSLTAKPAGNILGNLRNPNGEPLTGAIKVLNTPLMVQTDENGRFALTLPAGTYQLQAAAGHHRLAQSEVTIRANQTRQQDFSLVPGPDILLVDSGAWLFDSQAGFFEAALEANDYFYDSWPIDDPYNGLPAVDDLAAYDLVIWSAPDDSPGRLEANDVLTSFLSTGGRLLISGQDIGRLDGDTNNLQVWWQRDLGAHYEGQILITETAVSIQGQPDSPYADLNFTLNDGDSANNQTNPDIARPRLGTLTRPNFIYGNGTPAGLQATECAPFRIIYLGFGLEGVTQASDRKAIMGRSLETLQAPASQTGVQWQPEQRDDLVLPGAQTQYILTLQNMSATLTDTFQIQLENNAWPGQTLTPTLTLGPCESGQTAVQINIPPNLAPDQVHTTKITAVSSNNNQVQAQFTLNQKTPGNILLVDDDRFYDREDDYKNTLDKLGLKYDVWETGDSTKGRGSPPANLLQAYPFIIWFTGYDWHDPITPEENAALYTYLEGNGRLFLSSQDFLYYNQNSALARAGLGIVAHRESITPTMIFAEPAQTLPTSLNGPLPLTYAPYQNFSDALMPASDSQPFLWHENGLAGTARANISGSRAVFWGIPFEALPASSRADGLESVLGWLSDLGDSTLVVDQRVTQPAEARTFTLTLKNNSPSRMNHTFMTTTLPLELAVIPGSISKFVEYDPAAHLLRWDGKIQAGETKTFSFQAVLQGSSPAGARLDTHMTIAYARHGLTFTRSAPIWVQAPDLSLSTLTAVSHTDQSIQFVTYTLSLHNTGLSSSDGVTAVLRLPDMLNILTPTLQTSSGTLNLGEQRLIWQAALAANKYITASVVTTRTIQADGWLQATAVIDDGVTTPLIRSHTQFLAPYQSLFPIIFTGKSN